MNMTNKRDCFHSLLVILCLLSTYSSSSVKVAAAEKEFMESSSAMDNTRQLASSSVWTNFLSKFDVLSRIYSKKKEESKEYNLTFLPSFRFAALSTSSSSLPS